MKKIQVDLSQEPVKTLLKVKQLMEEAGEALDKINLSHLKSPKISDTLVHLNISLEIVELQLGKAVLEAAQENEEKLKDEVPSCLGPLTYCADCNCGKREKIEGQGD